MHQYLTNALKTVVEVTQSWISGSAKSGPELDLSMADFYWLFQLFFAAFFGARRVQFGARIRAVGKKENVFLGQICSNFMRDTFTINIDFVSV